MPRAFAATALFTSAAAAARAPMLSSVRLFGLFTSRISHAGNAMPSASASDVMRIRFFIAPSSEADAGGERDAARNRHLPAVRPIQEIAVQSGRPGARVAAAVERGFRIHAGEAVVDPERQVARAEAELRARQSPAVDEGSRHPIGQR